MAKIMLIGLYDNWTLGLRTLANSLLTKGHSVSIVHFKLPAMHNKPFFLKHTRQYQTLNTLHAQNKVVVQWYNTDAVMWTHNEVHLLGDLLEHHEPDIIGLSTRSVYEKDIFDLIYQMKRVNGAITIAGGHDASFRPEYYIDYVDYVCIGEGEETLNKLAEAVDLQQPHSDIPNLVYKINEKIIRNPMSRPDESQDYFFREDMQNIDHYLIDFNQIQKVDYLFRDICFPANDTNYFTFGGRGCTGLCTFCSAGQFQRLYNEYGHTLKARRMRPIENIIREISSAKEKGFTKVYFLDSFLVASKKYLLSFFESYEKASGLPFFAQLHPEQVLDHPEILDAAIRAGMDEVVIGIQSGSERINKEIFNRKTPHGKILRFAEMCSARGNIKLDYHFITHNPFEEDQDYEATIDLIGKLPKKGTHLVLRPLYPFANTAINRMIIENGPLAIDNEFHYKLLLLYLCRYAFPDNVFDEIRYKFKQMTIADLINFYEEMKKTYKSDYNWVSIGAQLYKANKMDDAIAVFNAALKLNHNYYMALRGIGLAYFGKGDMKMAEKYLLNALIEYPKGDKDILRALGEVSIKEGRLKKGLYYYQNAFKLASPFFQQEYSQILLRLGWLYAELGQWGESVRCLKEARGLVSNQKRLEIEKLISQVRINYNSEHLHQMPVKSTLELAN